MCLISLHRVGRASKKTRLLNGQEKSEGKVGRSKKYGSDNDAIGSERALRKNNNLSR